MLLMCAFACAIFVGTSALIPHDPYTSSEYIASLVSGAAVFLAFCSLFGGYLVSYGFLYIVRDSRRTESTTQE